MWRTATSRPAALEHGAATHNLPLNLPAHPTSRQGEPLNNERATLQAIQILTHPLGADLALRRVCVSTVGLVPALRRLAAQTDAAIAVSLHATTDELRDWLVPVNRRHPLQVGRG